MGLRLEGEPLEQDEVTTDNEGSENDEQHIDTENADDEGNTEALITIGEPPEDTAASSDDGQNRQPAPAWAKELRKDHRRLQRENAELKRSHQSVVPTAVSETDVLPAPPTLEACGWDEAEFRKQTAEHVRKEAAIEARKAHATADAERQRTETAQRITAYKKAAGALKVADFEDAEDAVVGTLSEIQQGILLEGSENPALIVYALGKNPEKAAELAKITNPVRFAFAAAKLEKEIKVTPRKSSKPAPEIITRSSATMTGGGNTALDAARRKAEQTGDYTEVNRIRKQLRSAARK